FRRYSTEQNPPPDDFDWASYLIAKQLHRFLIAANGDYAADHLRSMFASFQESPSSAYPTCALDFATTPQFGQRAFHALELQSPVVQTGVPAGVFHEGAFCASSSGVIDVAPPHIDCGSGA